MQRAGARLTHPTASPCTDGPSRPRPRRHPGAPAEEAPGEGGENYDTSDLISGCCYWSATLDVADPQTHL